MESCLLRNGLQVFYHRRSGQGSKLPIVLLHGFTDNGRCWDRVAQDLAGGYDLIMPDARGHGRTAGDVSALSYELLGEDAVGLIQTLGLAQPILFGHSMGALTAMIAAARAPNLVRALILEDPPFWPAARQKAINVDDLAQQAVGGRAFQQRPLAQRIADCRASNPGWAEDEVIPWAESKGEYDPEIMAPANRLTMHSFAWKAAAAKVRCPTLLLTADPGKGIVTPETAVEAASLMANCEVVQIANAGHCIHRDAYAETMQHVDSFLGKVGG